MGREVYSKRQIRRVSSRTSFSRLASETTNKSSFQGRNAHATEVYPRWIDIVLVQTGHARNYNSVSTVMLVLAQKKSAGSSVRSTFNIDNGFGCRRRFEYDGEDSVPVGGSGTATGNGSLGSGGESMGDEDPGAASEGELVLHVEDGSDTLRASSWHRLQRAPSRCTQHAARES